MKRIWGGVVCLAVAAACSAGWGLPVLPSNPGFEGGMTPWTWTYQQDGSNNGFGYQCSIINAVHRSGQNSLFGYASINGDYSAWQLDDWCRVWVWSESVDLRWLREIDLSMTGLSSSGSHLGWGWGQEIFLLLDDGTNQLSCLLYQNHEQPYGVSIIDQGMFATTTGNDGNTWYNLRAPISSTYWSGSLGSFNWANCKIGIEWEAINWNSSPENLWMGSYVDDVNLIEAPEPVTMSLFAGSVLAGLGTYLRRRK